MVPQLQEQKLDKLKKRKSFPWMRIIVTCIALLLITVGVILSILGFVQGSTVLTVFGIVIGLFQWLFPISSGKSDPSSLPPLSHPAHITVNVPSSLNPSKQLSLPIQTVPFDTIENSPTDDAKIVLQSDRTIKVIDVIDLMQHDHHKAEWGEAPDIGTFYGRQEELAKLEQWVTADHCRLVGLFGMGGIGKTSLSAKMGQQIKSQYDYIIWISLRNAPRLKDVLSDCILFLSKQKETNLPENTEKLISFLIEYFKKYSCLMFLDNVEAIMLKGDRVGYYREGYGDYGDLIRRVGDTPHKSCILLTSREKPKEFGILEGHVSHIRSMTLKGLRFVEGLELLRDEGVVGLDEAIKNLIQSYSGNPLALKLVSETVLDIFDGNVAAFLRTGGAVFGDIRDLIEQQFYRLSRLESNIMYWLAIEREAISLEELQKDFVQQILPRELLEAISSLRRRSLIERNGLNFTLQNVLLEYTTDRFVDQIFNEIITGKTYLFNYHALIKAQSKDYVRESQKRVILRPILQQLLSSLGKNDLELRLSTIISDIRASQYAMHGYGAGNTLNLLVELGTDLTNYDFSHLSVWEAYLQGTILQDVNFKGADLARSAFTESFGGVFSVAFSRSGQLFAEGGVNGEVRLRQTADGKHIATYIGHTGWVRAIAFSPDEETLATGSEDQLIKLWNLKTNKCRISLQGHTDRVRALAFSPDGSFLVSGSHDKTMRLWNAYTGTCIKIFKGHTSLVRAVAFSPDGHTLASGSLDQTVRLWDVNEDSYLVVLQDHNSSIQSVAFSPDGLLLASGSNDYTVRLWDVSVRKCKMIFHGHKDGVRSVVFSPDGQLLASSSDDRTVKLWDIRTSLCIKTLQGHTNGIWSVDFSPDGNTLISGSLDQTVRLWDVYAGQCLKVLQGFSNGIKTIAFNFNGQILASGSDDQVVRVWEVESGKILQTLQGHTSLVWSVVFSPDGHLVASGNDDRTIRLWDLQTGTCLNILRGTSGSVAKSSGNVIR